MKKYFAIFLLTLSFSLILSSPDTFAQGASTFTSAAATATATTTTINARILPTIWYSTLKVNDGDSIKIYAGIQNNSGSSFSGTAAFYVDNVVLSKQSFTSSADSLRSISADWVAVPGSHYVQVVLSPILVSGKSLVSYSSDKSNISIIRNITAEAVQEAAVNAATTMVTKGDVWANDLALKIESMKKPIVSATGGTAQQKSGAVLGTSTIGTTGTTVTSNDLGNDTDLTTNSPLDYVYNMAMDLLAFLVRGWKWTLSAIVLIFVIFKVKSWMKRE